MNRIYHLIFNRTLGLLQLAQETARSRSKGATAKTVVGVVVGLALASGPSGILANDEVIDNDEHVIVDGAGGGTPSSPWDIDGVLYVGHEGNVTLSIKDSRKVGDREGYIGYESGSTGTVMVTGENSEWVSDWLHS